MPFVKKKLVTMILPEAAEPGVASALREVSTGFSVTAARGTGQHGARPDIWHGGNVQIDVVVSPSDMPAIEAILDRLHPATHVVAWIVDVDAWPADKFG